MSDIQFIVAPAQSVPSLIKVGEPGPRGLQGLPSTVPGPPGATGPEGPAGELNSVLTDDLDLNGHQVTDATQATIIFDAAKDVELGTVTYEKLTTIALTDNQTTPFQFYSFDTSTTSCVILQYSAKRGLDLLGHGTITASTNGTAVTLTDTGGDLTLTLGLSFAAAIVNTTVSLLYSTTATGTAGTMAFKVERWRF